MPKKEAHRAAGIEKRHKSGGREADQAGAWGRQRKKSFLAADADPALQDVVRALCEEKQIPAVEVPSMKELGRACSIAVGAAVAAIVQAEKP